MSPARERMPDRRPSVTQTLEIAGQVFNATVGFDKHGRPREVFLTGAKEGSLLAAILAARKPVLGICYGMQLMNAFAGGAIYADVERQAASALVHSQKRGGETHPVVLAEGSHLRALLGQDEIEVNTRHIQAIATTGAGFRVAATAPDGVVEAIENEDGTLLGLQFHPERMGTTMHPLFRHLIEQAQARRITRSAVLDVPT